MQRKNEYDAMRELGAPVTLIDAVEEREDGSVRFPNLDMLLATVAVVRVLQPVQLVGTELRFLRRVLEFTGAEFAEAIGLSDTPCGQSVVSRWENDKVRPGSFTEKVVRQLVLNLLGPRAPGIEIPENAIPGMKIRPRELVEGALRIALRLERQAEAAGQSAARYAAAA